MDADFFLICHKSFFFIRIIHVYLRQKILYLIKSSQPDKVELINFQNRSINRIDRC